MIQILIALIFSIIIAQLIDFIISFVRTKKFDLKKLWGTGGFPSSHAAGVSTLSTAIYLTEGISMSFVVALALTFVVCRDAIGVRREVGTHAKELNKISKTKRFNELSGHTPFQVFGGIVLGIIVAMIFM